MLAAVRKFLESHRLRLQDYLGLRLARTESLLQLSVLAILVGLQAGLVVILFRLLVELVQASFLPGGDPENYEALDWTWRLGLPTLGALLIGLVFQRLARDTRKLGITHVLDRYNNHQGRLPLINANVQFLGAAASIISGHSVGREGPCVHLGATSGSILGQWLHLPNNHIRTLIGCGIAGAIAASFNTPLAGVVFAMEVVLMEYSVVGFAPIIIAAVCATTLSRAVFGSDPAFAVPNLELGTLWELPYVLVTGILIGALSALFTHLLQLSTRTFPTVPVWQRMTLGGLLVGCCALVYPEVMGIGYDTVNAALLGELGFGLLIGITTFKILATAVGLGLGLPGGLIGPTLVIGATAGGAMAALAQGWLPDTLSSPAFYALIGMGTMMGATLQAPLAALTAMLELTGNPNIILPGMLALISAGMISKLVFKKGSIYHLLLQRQGLKVEQNPLALALRGISVASTMERRVVVVDNPQMEHEAAQDILRDVPRWLMLPAKDKSDDYSLLIPAADLARFMAERGAKEPIVDLDRMPARHLQAVPIDLQATLAEALEALTSRKAEAVFVVRRTIPGLERVYGVLTRSDIEASYRT